MGARKLSILIYLLFVIGNGYTQEKDVILIPKLTNIKDSIEFRKNLTTITDIVFYNRKPISSQYLDSLLNIGEKLRLFKTSGKILRLKGIVQERNLKYYNAFKTYKQALEACRKVGDQKGIATMYNHMYIIKYHLGYLQESVEYLLEAKNIYEKLNDTKWLGIVYNNLALVHLNLKRYRLSEEEYLKSISYGKKSKDSISVGLAMNNLIELYLVQKNFKKAKGLLGTTIAFNKKNKNLRQIGYAYYQHAYFFVLKNQFREARKYYDSISYLYDCDYCNNLVITAKQQLGFVEIHLKNYRKAEKLLTKTRQVYCTIDAESSLLENYRFSFKLDSTRGNLKGAMDWQRKYQKLSDRRISEMSAKKIENAELRYKEELAQLKKIDEQARRERKVKVELYQYRVLILVVVGGGVASLLFLFWAIKIRKDREKIIVNLDQSNQIKNKLFSMISHDLKNEVFELETSLNMMKHNTMVKEEFDQVIPLLVSRTHQTSILLHNLLNWSKSQMNALDVKPVNFDIIEVISTIVSFFKLKAQQKNIQLVSKLESMHMYADKDMILIVAQNLIANSIKNCNSGDSILLDVKEKESCNEIRFMDTGMGITQDHINKLFTEEKFIAKDAQNELGIGLGLRICKELVELNNGNIKIESTLGKGSTFIISLPKAMV